MTITIQGINWEQAQRENFYDGEIIARELVNLIGKELTIDLMRANQVDDQFLVINGTTYYRKDASVGHYQTLFGETVVSRHLYQTSAGGGTICPMVIYCQMSFGSVTPMLAEVASFKLASIREAKRNKIWPRVTA
jgi:hypothetical protein